MAPASAQYVVVDGESSSTIIITIVQRAQELCKDFSNALDVCLNMPNGMRLPNPVECRPGGVASSFMYCLNEVPIPTACPADTTWNFQLLSCVTATGVPKVCCYY